MLLVLTLAEGSEGAAASLARSGLVEALVALLDLGEDEGLGEGAGEVKGWGKGKGELWGNRVSGE